MNTKSHILPPLGRQGCVSYIALICLCMGCADRQPQPEPAAPPVTAPLTKETPFTQETPESPAAPESPETPAAPESPVTPETPVARESTATTEPVATGRVRFSKTDEVWIDTQQHQVIVSGAVSLREGMLEMFACPAGTKEHESVVAVKSKAAVVHAALLAVGAQAGHPAQFDPEYRPAEGMVVDIDVTWTDADGQPQTTRAQNWVQHLPTGKPMPYDWVFGGSSFWKDDASGQEYYQAEGGELICLSNFSTATLDLPVSSSQANANLLFGAFTKNIPELGTPVQLILRPRMEASQPVRDLPPTIPNGDEAHGES